MSQSSAPTRPVELLLSSDVLIREVLPEDVEWLFHVEVVSNQLATWRLRGATPSRRVYEQTLMAGDAEHFIVEVRSSLINGAARVGIVSLYNHNHRDRHCFLSFASVGSSAQKRMALVGCLRVIDWAMSAASGMRKLYLEVPAYNLEQIASGVGRMLRQEAVLRERQFFQGKYHDVYILSISNGEWHARRPSLVALLRE